MIELVNKNQINYGSIISFNKGEYIFRELDICDKLYFIMEGEVIISSSDLMGNEDIFNHLYKGDVFGNNLLFSNHNSFLGDAKAIVNTQILMYTKDAIMHIFLENPKFLEKFLSLNANATISAKIKNKILAKRNIKERILFYLNINGGNINISINQLANELILNRVCVSRVISELIEEGIIKKEGKKIKII